MTEKAFTFEAVEEIIGYIMTYMKTSDYGSFLTSFFETFQRADQSNRRILKPIAVELIIKYKLDEDAKAYKDGTK